MKFINKYNTVVVAAAAALAFTSCDDYLDKLPDNRAELDTDVKIENLLVSAYPTNEPMIFGEYMSDNVDDMGANNPYSDRFLDQVYHWEDVNEGDNSSPESYWEDLNLRVESANTALQAVEATGCTTTTQKAIRAEALLCRAYCNFMLVNIFGLHYDPKDKESLGICCNKEPETTLNPSYKRGTVYDNYADIQADIEAALPDVSDEYYSVPKYHFNQNAAYAFATRFYLFTQQWDKAITAANHVLGSNPASMLRDYQYLSTMTSTFDAIGNHYIDATLNCNLLLMPAYSRAGVYFGPYYTSKRYSHNAYIGTNETVNALAALWGGTYSSYFFQIKRYSGTNLDTWSKWSIPYLFEYTDPVAQIGYAHSIYYAFTGDEVLLSRAEAYVMKEQYELAAADMTTYMRNVSRTASQKKLSLTPTSIKAFMDNFNYSYEVNPESTPEEQAKQILVSTPKKHLHPCYSIGEEGSVMESMIQTLLLMRRYEFLHEGKRWFDIKRFGIEIPRRTMSAAGTPKEITDWLKVDDPRRAVQIPQKAVEAGFTPNPRNK